MAKYHISVKNVFYKTYEIDVPDGLSEDEIESYFYALDDVDILEIKGHDDYTEYCIEDLQKVA